MSYQLWHLVSGAPALLGTRDDKAAIEKLRRMEAGGEPTAIGKDGVVLGSMHTTPKQLDAFRAVVKAAHIAAGGAPPAPLPAPTDAPSGRSTGMVFGRGKPLAASHDDESDEEEGDDVVAVAPAPKVGRPTTRPPLARRRVTSVAGGTLTATPVAAESRCPIGECPNPPLAASARCDPAYRPLCASHRALAHRAARTLRLSSVDAVAHVASRAGQSPVQPAGSRSVPRPAPVVAAPRVDASAELQQARERATAAERSLEQCRDDANVAGVAALREAEAAAAKIAGLQRLLGQVTGDRDALRDRIESAERAAADAARIARDAMEHGLNECDWTRLRAELAEEERDEARVEKLEALGAEAYAWDLLDLAMTTGLGAVTEARAETDAMCRQAGELSRQLGAVRDELAALRAVAPVANVPASVLLDELMLERIAQRAARRAVVLQGDAAKLARLAQEHGGADALVRLVEGAMALRKAVG